MMNTMRGFFNPNHLDQSSRANDVIVIRHRDGSLHCTPFNVRFGKVQIWNSNDKVVQVEVNGELTAAFMKIGEGGEAYWLQPTYAHAIGHGAAEGKAFTHSDGSTPGGITGSPADDGSSLSSLVGTEFSINDDFPVRPESPVDLWEAQAHPITAELAAHATVLDDTQPRSTSEDSIGQGSPTATRTGMRPNTVASPTAMAEAAAANAGEEVDATPLLQGDDHGRYKVVREAIHSAGDAQEANLALQAMAAAEKAERRLSSMMPLDPYLKEQALTEFPEAATAPPHPASPNERLEAAEAIKKPAQVEVEVTPLAVEMAAAQDSSAEEPLDLNASKRESGDDTLEGGGDEYYLEPLDIEDYVDLYGEEDLLQNTSFTSSDAERPATDAAKANKGRDAHKPGHAAATTGSGASTSTTGANKDGAAVKTDANQTPSQPGRDDKNNTNSTNTSMNQGNPYFTRTLIPVQADLVKLSLKDGCNHVRYLTRKTPNSEDVVAVTCNIFLWDYRDRIVVSDVDGTITKSDLWGHFYSMLGKGGDWTHPGICSLYSKIDSNGYRMVYLTARSVSQINQTKQYLWTLDQDGARLPLGPVLTVPQKFFTALTQEVSKRSHIFKIACLTSLKDAFPPRMKPFFAGFGNRYNDVLSYVAVGVPQHKIFIIDPSSVLHVARVKQTYPNLAKLVDVTFPPVKHHHRLPPNQPLPHGGGGGGGAAGSGAASTASIGSVYGSSDDDDDLLAASPTSLEELAATVGSQPTKSAAFAMVGNDLTCAKLNPDDHDDYHSISPGGTGPSAEPSTHQTVPGAAHTLTSDQLAAAAAVTITSGTVLTGKVAQPSTTAAGGGASAPGSSVCRGVVIQAGNVPPAPPNTSAGLFVRPANIQVTTSATTPGASGGASQLMSPQGDDVQEDADFSAYNFWRVDPQDLVTPSPTDPNKKGANQASTGPTKGSPVASGTAASGKVVAGTAVVAGRVSSPSNVYSPTTVRESSATSSRAPVAASANTREATNSTAAVRVTDAVSVDDKKTKNNNSNNSGASGGGGGGFFSFGFGRGGPSASEKKKAQEEAAALASAKQRTHMHPDSLDYYFANSTTQPSSGSGAAAARDLLGRGGQEAPVARSSPQTPSPPPPPRRGDSAAAPKGKGTVRSTSPSWAFWRRNSTITNGNVSADADAAAGDDSAPQTQTGQATETLTSNASATAVHVPPQDADAAAQPTSPEEAKTAAGENKVKPTNSTSPPSKQKPINIDDLFEFDIAPLLEKMDASMETIRDTLVPMLRKLEEDTLVAHYSLEEQARLSLSAAFAIAFSLYSLDKLQNKQHAHLANVVGQSLSPTTDAQLVLKIERITDYIKKLREITLLNQQQQQHQEGESKAAASSSPAETATKAGSKRTQHPTSTSDDSAETPHKMAKHEVSTDADADNLGDAEMFSVVSRVPGETGTAVSRLIHQTKAANNVATKSTM